MGTNTKLFLLLLTTALLASSAFLIPAAREADAEPALTIAFASTITQLLALWYFLSSLKIIKRSLRIAYYLFALGVFLFSCIQLLPSLSVVPAFGQLYANATIANILFLTPFALGAFFMYLGIWLFARLLKTGRSWLSFLLVTAIAGIAAVVFVMLPNPGIGIDATARAVMALCGIFSAAAAFTSLRIREKIGETYKVSISWTTVALVAISFTTFHELIVKTYFIESGYAMYSFSLWPYLLTGILLLRAGLSFKETGRGVLRLPANASFVDVVIGTAELVSNPDAVDIELDKVRSITSQGGTELSSSQKDTLVSAYLHIEDYLTKKEPLYAYDAESLRTNLPTEFLQRIQTVHQNS